MYDGGGEDVTGVREELLSNRLCWSGVTVAGLILEDSPSCLVVLDLSDERRFTTLHLARGTGCVVIPWWVALGSGLNEAADELSLERLPEEEDECKDVEDRWFRRVMFASALVVLSRAMAASDSRLFREV